MRLRFTFIATKAIAGRQRRWLLALGGWLLTGLASAATPPPVEEFVVSAHRLPAPNLPNHAPVLVIDRATIETSPASTLAQLLDQQGVINLRDAQGDGAETQISMRGFGANAGANSLVVVDGRELNPQDLSTPDLNSIALGDIERIEILNDSGGVLYGDQAVGGVVYISTRPATRSGLTLSAGRGSFDERRLSAVGSFRGDELGVRLSTHRRRQDGYRDGARLDRTDWLARIEVPTGPKDGGQLTVEYARTEQDRIAMGGLTKPERRLDDRARGSELRIDGQTDTYRLNWASALPVGGRLVGAALHVDAFHTDVSSDSPSNSMTFGRSLTEIERRQSSFDPRLILEFAGLDQARSIGATLILGADLDRQELDFRNASEAFGTSGSRQKTDVLALYATFGARFREHWHGQIGARTTRVDSDIIGFARSAFGDQDLQVDQERTPWAAEGSIRYQSSPQWQMTLRTGRSFRLPKADEQASVFTGFNGLTTQTGVGGSLTLDWDFATTQGQATFYGLRLDDEIDFDPRSGLFGDNVNLDRTTRVGLAVQHHYPLGAGLTMLTNAHLIRARQKSGERLPLVAERSARLALRYQPPTSAWLRTELAWQYTGPRYAIGDFDNARGRQGGFAVWHAALLGRVTGDGSGALDFSLRIENLLDRRYDEVTTFASFLDAIIVQPGVGRRFLAEVTYSL